MASYMQGQRARLTVTIDPELYQRVQELGRGRRGGVSGVVEDCLRGYLDWTTKEAAPLTQKKSLEQEMALEIVYSTFSKALSLMKEELDKKFTLNMLKHDFGLTDESLQHMK